MITLKVYFFLYLTLLLSTRVRVLDILQSSSVDSPLTCVCLSACCCRRCLVSVRQAFPPLVNSSNSVAWRPLTNDFLKEPWFFYYPFDCARYKINFQVPLLFVTSIFILFSLHAKEITVSPEIFSQTWFKFNFLFVINIVFLQRLLFVCYRQNNNPPRSLYLRFWKEQNTTKLTFVTMLGVWLAVYLDVFFNVIFFTQCK